eukprot:TRINITY_DN1722_c3_g1_i1.p1 TRINITY_DN1722_c3_g1~~TRINITY_DN1722_c3_g1_i1.p1  ORF type:complete len:575 (-),score=208.39 TRINITY_DN1722_c3_g1_i1:19-1722(-)
MADDAKKTKKGRFKLFKGKSDADEAVQQQQQQQQQPEEELPASARQQHLFSAAVTSPKRSPSNTLLVADNAQEARSPSPTVEQQQQRPASARGPSAAATAAAAAIGAFSEGQRSAAGEAAEVTREKINWHLHTLYIRKEWDACLQLAETWLAIYPACEYPLYIKALIKRHQGEIQESFRLFEQCYVLNPSANNIKQIARSYFLLGKHKQALRVFEKVEKVTPDDWEVWHNKGMCFKFLRDYDKAIECFKRANSISKHDVTYMQLGKLYHLLENYKAAIEVYLEALEFSPENPDLLTTLGLLYLRTGENYRAFDYFGNALSQDPTNPKTILATGSIIQDRSEVEVALIKYRVAAVQTPHSPQLWNNIGMCFFGKQKFVAAIAALKKALYYAPFEWLISYNLGVVHLTTKQYASAFQFFQTALSFKEFPHAYMYLGVTLSRLSDFASARECYKKALQLAPSDFLIRLNYAITLYMNKEVAEAKVQFTEFEKLWHMLDDEVRNGDFDILEQRGLLFTTLYGHEKAAAAACGPRIPTGTEALVGAAAAAADARLSQGRPSSSSGKAAKVAK